MRQIGREEDLEKINRTALKIAREVANKTGTLMAGAINNTNIYVDLKERKDKIRAMFEEQVSLLLNLVTCIITVMLIIIQVRWSKEEGADYMIAETLYFLGEAEIALDVILSFGLPAVVTLAVMHVPGSSGMTFQTLDGVPIARACRILLDKGATLVGSNCFRGPDTMIKVIEEIVKEVPPEKVCALPVCYRTTDEYPTFMDFEDKACSINNPVYPHGLDAFQVSTREVTKFTKRCKEIGLKYLGLCCGNTGNYTRAMAEALGRKPPASKYLNLDKEFVHPLKRQEILEKEA